jgi:hypothetical protein
MAAAGAQHPVLGGQAGASGGSSALGLGIDADNSTTITSGAAASSISDIVSPSSTEAKNEAADTHEDDSAADAPSAGSPQEAPTASPTSVGADADSSISTMLDVTDAGTSNAPAANEPATRH